MGRPYAAELNRLNETYSWALNVPVESLVTAVSSLAGLPLVAVGSGGSFTAAHLACALHQHYTGMVSRPFTPLELMSSRVQLRSLGVMVLSAGGSNTDIISAFEKTVLREPRRCLVLCLRKGSSLARLANSYRFVDLLDLNIPSIKDGFLATNSLLAFSVLLVRAYARVFSVDDCLPSEFEKLLSADHSNNRYLQNFRDHCAALLNRETLVVLYGTSVSSAALDLESKFSEAALGNIQLADIRNFAHGRHHWLAKYPSKTGVLAIFTEDERELIERTLRLIPGNVPVARIFLRNIGPTANIAALVVVFHLVGAAGEKRGIDPGRPGVPLFGRRIYGLRVLRSLLNDVISLETIAIARKLGEFQVLRNCQDFAFWQESYRRFVDGLQKTSFSAIVFDYDGTLCDEQDRFKGLRDDIIRHLDRLVRSGIVVGVATGRGKSVRKELRKGLSKNLWGKVYLGYYNGAEVASLCDDDHPNPSRKPNDSLKIVAEAVSKNPIISRVATCEPRRAQVSVQPMSAISAELIWRILQPLAQGYGLVALRSSHSIDLLDRHVSKRSLLIHLRKLVPEGSNVLLIGDKGKWPGNDYHILSEPHSLSVDEVSVDPNTCWNLAPPGHRGVQATLDYLSWIQIRDGSFSFILPSKLSGLS